MKPAHGKPDFKPLGTEAQWFPLLRMIPRFFLGSVLSNSLDNRSETGGWHLNYVIELTIPQKAL